MAFMSNYACAVPSATSERVTPQIPFSEAGSQDGLIINPGFSLDRDGFKVRLAGAKGHLRAKVDRLVTSLYGSRGLVTATSICTEEVTRTRGPEQVTIVAAKETDVFGTLTLTIDSDRGLLADSLYRSEIDPLREEGRRLCEVTRLALDSQINCLEVMAALFNVAFVLASDVHARTDLVAEVHPRHVGFYRRTMGYRVVGPERICQRVGGAPAVLMHLPLDYARSQIHQLAGTCLQRDRNLYRLFLPIQEQYKVLEKLTRPVTIPVCAAG